MRRLISFLILFFSATCTTMSKYDETKDQLKPSEQKKLDEFRAELEIGRNMAGRLLQFYGTHDDPVVLAYLNQIGSYVASYSEFPARKYMFEIIDTEAVNAFACPGGYILITMGALRHAENEAELGHVLSHEVTHVGKKHMFDRLQSMSEEEMQKANDLAKEKLNLPETVLVRERPEPEDNKFGDVMAKYLAGGAGSLGIIKAAGAGMSVMLEQGLGAEKEYEADSDGVKHAVAAGYEPTALIDYLCRLKGGTGKKGACSLKTKMEEPKSILDKTHPSVPDRIANIEKTLKAIDGYKIVGASGVRRFKRHQERLPKVAQK